MATTHLPFYRAPIFWGLALVAALVSCWIEWLQFKTAFERKSHEVMQHVQTQVGTFEVALEGFARFLSVSDSIKDDQIRAYTHGIRQLYPSIYMFEVATHVKDRQRQAFVKRMRESGYPEYSIKVFDYEHTRSIKAADERSDYYPIRFIDPETPETAEVLGLDLGSTSNLLQEALFNALGSDRPVATRPFELLEGGKGYVIYRPAISPATGLAEKQSTTVDFAMLVIRAKDLLPGSLLSETNYAIRLALQTDQKVSEGHTLIHNALPVQTGLLSMLPPLQRVRIIESESQPFAFTIQARFGWSDFHWNRFLLALSIGLLLVINVCNYLSRSRQKKHAALQKQLELYELANYDSLTHLPNINLLLDKAEQVIRMAKRASKKVGVCYLDLDKFKFINDTYGHAAGDAVLVEIALRLTKMLRDEDTASRIHGDEFVILLPDISSRESLDLVMDKILTIFSEPVLFSSQPIVIGGSIGAAMYPEDGLDIETLINKCDQAMYRKKGTQINALALPQN